MDDHPLTLDSFMLTPSPPSSSSPNTSQHQPDDVLMTAAPELGLAGMDTAPVSELLPPTTVTAEEVFRSKKIADGSKTPYSDATQVRS